MKTKIYYKKQELEKLLVGYKIVHIPINNSSEDYDKSRAGYYISNRDDIIKINLNHSLWTEMILIFKNGKRECLYGDNVNTSDVSIMRINYNNIISPEIQMNECFIKKTEELRNWLVDIAKVDINKLCNIEVKFDIYDIIQYPGVGTPVFVGGSLGNNKVIGISSETLKLSEFEIKEVLESIQDKLLREKINQILHANVFRSKH